MALSNSGEGVMRRSYGSNGAAVNIREGEDGGPEALASLGLMMLSKMFKQPLWERRGRGGKAGGGWLTSQKNTQVRKSAAGKQESFISVQEEPKQQHGSLR